MVLTMLVRLWTEEKRRFSCGISCSIKKLYPSICLGKCFYAHLPSFQANIWHQTCIIRMLSIDFFNYSASIRKKKKKDKLKYDYKVNK